MDGSTRNLRSPSDSDDVSAADPWLGRVIDDRYRLVAHLGQGGIGVVYRAEHLKLGHALAIKVLAAEYASSDVLRKRFEREARALASLAHPHVVPISDYGICDGAPYLVMELLEGRTLDEDIAADAPFTRARALHIARQVLQALSFAHGRGLVHRDLKPGNIFLQRLPNASDHVRLLDFGLARFLMRESGASGPRLTQTGTVFGTPAYMAPEQATGSETDERTDVYACGLILFELLTGNRPFEGEPAELLRQHLLVPVPAVSTVRPEVGGPQIDALVARATAKVAAERFVNAGEMLRALEDLPTEKLIDKPAAVRVPTRAEAALTMPALESTKQPPVPSRPTWMPIAVAGATLGALGLLGGIALLGFLMLGGDDAPAPAPAPVRVPVPTFTPPPPPQPTKNQGAVPVSPPATTPQSGDLWAAPIPPLLATARARLDGGRTLSDSTIRRLRTMAREDRTDPRPLLLMGRSYVLRGWRSDGLEHYERAFETDPRVRTDPHMRADMVALAAHGAVGGRAANGVRRIYGRDAVPEVDARLARTDLEASERERLGRLRRSLAGR